MRSVHIGLGFLVAATLAAAACGGGGSDGGGGTPAPSPNPTPATPSVTVSIEGDLGNRSFDPNPVTPGGALTVAWHNDDGQVHRLVANDDSFDTGTIAAGATSTTVTVPSGGVNYHCTIHPTMVGAINSSGGATPPCTGIYC